MLSILNMSRGFRTSTTPLRSEAEKGTPTSVVGSSSSAAAGAAQAKPGNNFDNIRPTLTATKLDRRFLVWSGHYKTTAEVPATVDYDVIQRTRSWARIRINIIAIGFAALGSIFMVYSGKQAAKRGESIEQKILDQHRKNREEYLRSTDAEAQKN